MFDYIEQSYESFVSFQQEQPVAAGALCSLGLLIGLAVALLLTRLFVARLVKRVARLRWASEGIRYRTWVIVPAEAFRKRFESTLWFAFGSMRIVAWFSFCIVSLALFPQTARYTDHLLTFLSEKLLAVGAKIAAYVPNLILIAIILFLTFQVLKLLKRFMTQVEEQQLTFQVFPAEYAAPTRQLLTFCIILFAMIIIAPYLPGAGTQAFQGITLFLGIIVSLGSSSAIANLIASFVLQYMRAFKTGDTVEIGGQVGRVTAVTLFSTRLRSLANEEIAIPNSVVLTSAMKNYSRSKRLAIKSAVSIGYDVPWEKVHKELLSAARKAEGVVAEPEPFVLQESLDDYCVSYEVYAYTDQVERIPHLRSRLNESIRTRFSEAGIEILSPAFTELRGKVQAIPA